MSATDQPWNDGDLLLGYFTEAKISDRPGTSGSLDLWFDVLIVGEHGGHLHEEPLLATYPATDPAAMQRLDSLIQTAGLGAEYEPTTEFVDRLRKVFADCEFGLRVYVINERLTVVDVEHLLKFPEVTP